MNEVAYVIWDGDNIQAVMALLPEDNPPVYMAHFSNRDEIVGVWTPEGLKVAQIGDRIGIEDGHPVVVNAAPTSDAGSKP